MSAIANPVLAESVIPDSETARAAVNRQNAQHSTGPRTEEGRAAVRFNALKTGLYSETAFLPGENRANFDALGAALTAAHAPQSDAERECIRVIQESEWRIARLVVLETNLHTVGMLRYMAQVEEEFGPLDDTGCRAMAQAAAYLAHSRQFAQIQRQEAHLHRLQDRTRRELARLKAERANAAGEQTKPVPATRDEKKPAQSGPAGFVPSHLKAIYEKYPQMPIFTGSFADKARKRWIKQFENAQRAA